MTKNQSPFMLLGQQGLVLAVVTALAVPALGVSGPDIDPEEVRPTGGAARALVATAPVEPTVRRVPLTPSAQARLSKSARGSAAQEGTRAVSAAEPVHGHGTVGVTWEDDRAPAEEDLRVEVRTSVGGSWSAWQEMDYHPEHAPDPNSVEGRAADLRAGTEPVVVGDVDRVQVRATTHGGALSGLALEIIDPGQGTTKLAEPAIDTGARSTANTSTAGRALAARTPPRPDIFRRWQWGADERLRDKGSLRYGRVRVGFVHHTVNANRYSSSQVPQIIRGIYAYHTRSRGWSDIGYNFLVDRFGRIWEGRAGGVNRSVVGAHTYGYNSRSFAMSAIGNFQTRRPSQSMVMAYGSLMGWKLGLHGVKAAKRWVWVRPHEYFRPVSGHRDAGATACPGQYLYSRLPDIRGRARWLQRKHHTFGKVYAGGATHAGGSV